MGSPVATLQQSRKRAAAFVNLMRDLHARTLWQERIPRVCELTAYAVNGRVLLLQLYTGSGGPGWEVWLPAGGGTNRIADTMEAVRLFIGSDDSPEQPAPICNATDLAERVRALPRQALERLAERAFAALYLDDDSKLDAQQDVSGADYIEWMTLQLDAAGLQPTTD